MDTSYKVPSQSPLDGDTCYRVVNHGVSKAAKKLKVDLADTKFNYEATSSVAGSPKAREYQGEFLISLDEQDRNKGFQAQLVKAKLDYSKLHDKFVDLQQASQTKQVSDPGNASVGMKLIEIEDKLKELTEDNKQLKVEVKQLREENKQLREENKQLREENKQIKVELKDLTIRSADAEAYAKSFEGDARLASKMRLRILIEAALEKLTSQLERAPEVGSPWEDFIKSITPDEMLRTCVSRSMLDFMAVGKKRPNKVAHQAYLLDVAIAVTRVQENGEVWRRIFKYAYDEDAEELMFGDD